MRAVVVYPSYAVWPAQLPVVQLLQLLHTDRDVVQQRRRLKLFLIVAAALFVWECVQPSALSFALTYLLTDNPPSQMVPRCADPCSLSPSLAGRRLIRGRSLPLQSSSPPL